MGISKVGNRFRARLYYRGTTYNIGTYDSHIKASRAINTKRRELKADEDIDTLINEVVQDKGDVDYRIKFYDNEPLVIVKKPSLFKRIWRKIKR
jgi:hypothetical protein